MLSARINTSEKKKKTAMFCTLRWVLAGTAKKWNSGNDKGSWARPISAPVTVAFENPELYTERAGAEMSRKMQAAQDEPSIT